MDFAEIRDEEEDEARERRPGCLRGLLRLLLLALAPLFLGVALLPTLMSSDGGRLWALRKINAAVAPAQVSFERWSLGWLTAVRLDKVTYTDAARGADATVERVACDRGLLRLLPLGVLNLGNVTLTRPEVALSLAAPPTPPVKAGEVAGQRRGFFLPVADLALTLRVEDGRASVTGDAPQPFVARHVAGTVTLPSWRKPISVQAQMKVGEGLVALEGRVQSPGDLSSGAALDQPETLTLKLAGVDLTEFRPLLEQATGAPWIHSGVAEGALTAVIRGAGRFTVKGGVLVSNLSVAAARQPRPPAGDLALMLDVAYDKPVVTIARFEFTSPWGTAEASGTLRPGAKTGALSAKADADLAAVARDFAPALGLSKGFEMRRGRLRAALALDGSAEALRVNADVSAADLAMTVDGAPFALTPAPALTFKATFPYGRWPEVETLHLKAPCADVRGSGRLDAAVVKATLDLTLFTRDFKRILKDAPPMVGAIFLDASTKRADGRVALTALVKLSDVAVELRPGQRSVVPQGALKFDGFVPLDGPPQPEIQDATFALTLDKGHAAGGWKRLVPAGRTDAGDARPLELRGFSLSGDMELDSARKLLGGFLPPPAQRRLAAWQGRVIANATAEAAAGAVKARVNAAGQHVAARTPAGAVWRVPDVRLEAALTRDGPQAGLRLVASATGGGTLERDGATVFAEPSASLAVDALLAPGGLGARVTKFDLASALLAVQAQADLTELPTRGLLAAQGTAAVDFGAVTELLTARGADEYALAGREPRAFTLEAPLAGGAATALAEGQFAGAAFLASLTGPGLRAGPADATLRLSKGVLRLAYEPTLNAGKLRLVPEIDAAGAPPALRFPARTRLLEDVAITQGMVDTLLAHVNPLFQGSRALGGTVSLDLRSCRVAAGQPPGQGVSADMDILFKNLKLELGPSLRDLLALLKVKDPLYSAERLPVHAVVKDGRIQIDPVTMVIDRQPVVVSGHVAFDGTLRYLIEVPLTDRVTGGVGGKLLKGATVNIPVTGTLAEPRLDTRALQRAIGALVKGALSERAAEKVGTFLEKLQDELRK